jgi:D-3-phosphoglycerate dehydrogenase
MVNVAGIAEQRGISVKEVKEPAAVDFLNVITVSARDARGDLSVAGTTLGPGHRPRFVGLYGHDIDIEPVTNMVFLRATAQVPGTFGKIGTKMGEFGVNISQVTVAPSKPGEPEVMGLAVSDPISDGQLAEIVAAAGLLEAKRVTL